MYSLYQKRKFGIIMVTMTSCHSSKMTPLRILLAAVFLGTSQFPKQLLYLTIIPRARMGY